MDYNSDTELPSSKHKEENSIIYGICCYLGPKRQVVSEKYNLSRN